MNTPKNHSQHPHSQSGLRSTLRAMYQKPGALIATVVVVILGALVTFYLLQLGSPRINTKGYQVVYLTNGQAYFGRLQNISGEYLVVQDPYTAQSVASDTEKRSASSESSLIKVSQQVYGPEDIISIRSGEVLFWQNLRDDSKVAKAIADKE